MKPENLKRAQEVVGLLEELKSRVKFLEDEDTEVRLSMWHSKFGSCAVGSKYLSTGTQAALKAMSIIDVKKNIKDLETELEGL